jgi:hypothetical protein
MAANINPSFEIAKDDFVREYVRSVIKPYVDVLSQVDINEFDIAVGALKPWIESVLPGDNGTRLTDALTKGDIASLLIFNENEAEDIDPIYKPSTDVNIIKKQIVTYIGNLLLFGATENDIDLPNVWKLAKYRDNGLSQIFGEATDKLPISVMFEANSYQHLLTEDFTYGLLVGLSVCDNSDQPKFVVNLLGVNFDKTEIQKELELRRKSKHKYQVLIGEIEFPFNTPDFIQGVSTAAQWHNVDPHQIVTNLKDLENEKLMNF